VKGERQGPTKPRNVGRKQKGKTKQKQKTKTQQNRKTKRKNFRLPI
jgi:hypothetical protein